MIGVVVVVAHLLSAQCSGAACPNPCRSCAFQPVNGSNPSLAEWRDTFTQVARRQSDFAVPGGVANIEVGPNRTREAAEFPCKLMPAIGMAESSIKQFCDNDLTIISFDCGFGVMQVTSGAASYPGIERSAGLNVAAGADILAAKWNGNESFGGTFGDSDPVFLESWYFAVWAYNGFVYSNNPRNPDHPANRPPFNSPASLSRGSYPYQEIVWGYLEFPQQKEGEDVFAGVDITYPTGIPNQSGLFSVELPLPDPAHADSCVEVCPPSGCPPQDQRVLILDDKDAGFDVEGDVDTNAEGGFDDRFFSAARSNPATVTATWTGTAPSSGTFDVGGFIPLNPATNSAIRVVVHGRGAAQTFTMDQNVSGGIFQQLGQVVLREGDPVSVVVDNASADDGVIGFDAFRFVWRGDGDVEEGGACANDVDCAGDDVCVDHVCDPDEGVGEGEEGEGEEGEGEGEGDPPCRSPGACPPGGEGEGEGEDAVVEFPPSVRGGNCTCASSSTTSASLVLLLLLRLRRRQPRPQRL